MRACISVALALLLVTGSGIFSGHGLAQSTPLSDLLPGYPEGGSTVIVTNDGVRTCEEYAAIFLDPEEAVRLLADWGCQENVFRVYEDTLAPSAGSDPPYLQVGVTRYTSETGASAALPYVVQNLRPEGAHREIPMPVPSGDESRQFVADTEEGVILTMLVRSDSLLIGISTLLTAGDPVFEPVRIAEGMIARQAAPPRVSRSVPPAPSWDGGPLLNAAPSDLSPCLHLAEDEVLDFATMATRFPGIPDAAAQLQELGWRGARHRQFTCDPLPVMGLHWLDMSVHRFQDAPSAAAAVPFFAYARTVGTQLALVPAMQLGDSTAAVMGPSDHGMEYTLYLSTGPHLFRISAIALEEAPQADAEHVMTALYLEHLGNDAAAAADVVVPAPIHPADGSPCVGIPNLHVDSVTQQKLITYEHGDTYLMDQSPCPAPQPNPGWTSEDCRALPEPEESECFDALVARDALEPEFDRAPPMEHHDPFEGKEDPGYGPYGSGN